MNQFVVLLLLLCLLQSAQCRCFQAFRSSELFKTKCEKPPFHCIPDKLTPQFGWIYDDDTGRCKSVHYPTCLYRFDTETECLNLWYELRKIIDVC